jgi:hypothetical protein
MSAVQAERELLKSQNMSPHRTGTSGAGFPGRDCTSIVMLIILLLNMSTAWRARGVADRVDETTLAVDGVALEDQSKEQLVALLQSELSSGAYNKLENEEPFAERSRDNVFQLVIERIVRPEVVDSWNLWESLAQADEIKATVASEIGSCASPSG